MDGPLKPEPRLAFELPRWAWIAAIWSAVGLIDATQNVFAMRAEGMHHNWVSLFFTLLLAWVPWGLATPLVLRLGRRSSTGKWQALPAWIAHLCACAAIGLISSLWRTSFEELLNPWAQVPGPPPFRSLWLNNFYSGLLSYLILYSAILLVGHVLESRERLALQQTETARLNEQLSRAQLNALRRQIEPHFLFNTLNAIAGLVREKRNDAAVNMIAALSDFLRRVVQDSDRQQVSLGEEVEFARKYLDIQKMRFAERLQFSVDVPGPLLLAQVPRLILQPMVENAMKHGIAKRAQGGTIRICRLSLQRPAQAQRLQRRAPPACGWEKTHSGVGMSNMRTRLQACMEMRSS